MSSNPSDSTGGVVFHQIDPGRTRLFNSLANAVYTSLTVGVLTWAVWIVEWVIP